MFKKKFLTLNLALASLSIVATSISCTSNASKDENKDHQAILIKAGSKIKQQKVFTSKLTYAEMKEKFREFKKGQAIPWQDLKIVFPKLDSKIEAKLTLIENISQQSKMLKVLLILKIANQETEQVINITPTMIINEKGNSPSSVKKQVADKIVNNVEKKGQPTIKKDILNPIKSDPQETAEINKEPLEKLYSDENKVKGSAVNNRNSKKAQNTSDHNQVKQSFKTNNKKTPQPSKNNLATKLSDQQVVESAAARFSKAIKSINSNQVILLPYETGVKNLFEQKFKIAHKISQAIEEMTPQQLSSRPKEYLGNKQMLNAAFLLPIDWKLFTNYETDFYSKINFVKLNSDYKSGGYKIEYVFKKNKVISKQRSFFIKYLSNELEKSYVSNRKIVKKSLAKLKNMIHEKGTNDILKLKSKDKSSNLASEKIKYDNIFKSAYLETSAAEKNMITDGYYANKKLFIETYQSLGLNLKYLETNKVNLNWKSLWIPLTDKLESGGYEIKYILKKGNYISQEQKFFIKYAASKKDQEIANNQVEINNIALSFEKAIIKANKSLVINLPWYWGMKTYVEQIKMIENYIRTLISFRVCELNSNIFLADDFYANNFSKIFNGFPVDVKPFTSKNVKFAFSADIKGANPENDKLPNDAVTVSYQFVKDQAYISKKRFFYVKYPWDIAANKYLTNYKANNFANLIKTIDEQGIIKLSLDDGVNTLEAQKVKILEKIKSKLNWLSNKEKNDRPSAYPGTLKIFLDCFSDLGLDWSSILTHNVKFYWSGLWIPLNEENNEGENGGFKISYVFKRDNVFSGQQSLFIKYPAIKEKSNINN